MLLADGARGLLFFDRCLVYHLSIEERSAVKSVYVMQVGFVVFTMFSTSANAQYIDLLKNRSLHHWMTPAGENVEKGWACDPDGTLHLQGHGGNIISREKFGDFELWFEFRIAEGGNSGIKYRVKNYGNSLLGCEYQVLGDEGFPGLSRSHKTASIYDVFPPRANPTKRYTDDNFNVGKILVRGNRIRHWVNGQLTIDECAGSPRWLDAVQDSKFSERECFGQNRYGRIMLTDHNSEVWYRNVFITRR